MAVCEYDGCSRTDRIKRGYCHRHYEKLRRRGDLDVREKDRGRRFWSRVERTDYCWNWTGALASGYGRLRWNGENVAAHRIAYALLIGPIPDGLDLDHLCRNRACVRPDHLEPVTRRTNLLRGKTVTAAFAGRESCMYGHPLTPENVYLWHGARYCRTCRQAVQRDRTRPPRTVVEVPCVMCGAVFSFERGPGQSPNVCSAKCRKARQRKAAREFQRRKRAAALAADT